MVTLKVRKVGNSLGLVLPEEVVNRLRTKEGEEVFLIEGPNNTYRLTPFDPSFGAITSLILGTSLAGLY
jgi:Antidote-toxin recognition MazE, bacterial antitoxin